MKSNYLLFSLVSLLLISCNKKEVATVLPPQKIKVVEIIPKTTPLFNDFVGQIYGAKDIPIRARVEGYVEEIHFKEGSKVQKGDLLYVIDAAPFLEAVAAEKSNVSQAKTNLVQKESDLARIEPLAKIDAVSKRELDLAEANRDAAISALEAAHANLNIAEINLSYTRILAPITGVIGRTLAREGEFVGRDPNPVILNTVSNISTVRVQFFLSEIEYLKIAKEFIAEHKESADEADPKAIVELILADNSLYPSIGKINFIDRNVNSSTGAILIESSFPNPDRLLRPGQFARVRVQAREVKNALLVPQKSVSELQGQFSVMIVNSENKIETKQIEVGEKVRQFYIVEKGINPKEKVVIEGLQKVKSGMEVIPEIIRFENVQQTKN